MPMIGTGGAGITYMPIYGGLRYIICMEGIIIYMYMY